MKYHMRRNERQISDLAVIEEILKNGKYATVALCRNDEPYIVTMSYGYDAEKVSLYFHCAQDGLKTKFVTANPNVCATVIQDHGYKQTECSHAYRSVVIRGRIEILTEESDKQKAMDVMVNQLEEKPEIMRAKLQARTEPLKDVQIWKLAIEEVSGKTGG